MATSAVALAAGATLLATAFTIALLDRWLARRRAYELAWAVSLALFTMASAALWLGVATGWTTASFRAFYLFGAILNVPWLALGSILLLFGGRRSNQAIVALAMVSAFVAGILAVVPLHAPVPSTGLPEGRHVFGIVPRVLAAVGSGLAATIIVVLALWSAGRLWRSRRAAATAARSAVSPARLALGNLQIALGTIVLSASGTIAGRVGKTNAFAITLAIGIAVLFAGFLVATPNPGVRLRSAKQAAQDLSAQAAW